MKNPNVKELVRSWIGIDKIGRDVDHPCPSDDFSPGTPDGHCETDGHYMCRECVHASPAAIAERDEP
jgi:hypothetical protein